MTAGNTEVMAFRRLGVELGYDPSICYVYENKSVNDLEALQNECTDEVNGDTSENRE